MMTTDDVLRNMEAFKRREEIMKLREKVLQAEEQRLSGAKTLSLEEARSILDDRLRR